MKHNLLIVDDNEMMRSFLSHYFSANYQVKVAEGGTDAWQLLDEGYFPDLILLDLRMPDIDGFKCLKYIRENHPNPRYPRSIRQPLRFPKGAGRNGAKADLVVELLGRADIGLFRPQLAAAPDPFKHRCLA